MEKDKETLEQVAARHPELDDAARARAAARVAKGADPRSAVNEESVLSAMVRLYNR